jgi:carboxypeptidase PM20D1
MSWLGILFLLLIAVLLINTFRSRQWPVYPAAVEQPIPDSAIRHMSQAIQIPTISISDTSAIDTIAFNAFGTFMESAYPLIHQQLSKKVINQFHTYMNGKGRTLHWHRLY